MAPVLASTTALLPPLLLSPPFLLGLGPPRGRSGGSCFLLKKRSGAPETDTEIVPMAGRSARKSSKRVPHKHCSGQQPQPQCGQQPGGAVSQLTRIAALWFKSQLICCTRPRGPHEASIERIDHVHRRGAKRVCRLISRHGLPQQQNTNKERKEARHTRVDILVPGASADGTRGPRAKSKEVLLFAGHLRLDVECRPRRGRDVRHH